MTCTGNTNETCGGSNRMNVYRAVGSSGSSSRSSSSSLSSTSVSSGTVTLSTTPTSISTITTTSSSSSSSSTTTTTTPSTLETTTLPSSTPTSTPTPTKGFLSLGCYAEPPAPTRKPMTQILASDAMSPDLCISALASANRARALASSAPYAVFGLEYARECWAAATLVRGQTSLGV
ncbi:MAG: hypothetical protein LQ344_005990 [Seirophora lacunosa]|nr:MAG: hypothetical protein LQ344_005990 [Seirophora lacunosa]